MSQNLGKTSLPPNFFWLVRLWLLTIKKLTGLLLKSDDEIELTKRKRIASMLKAQNIYKSVLKLPSRSLLCGRVP